MVYPCIELSTLCCHSSQERAYIALAEDGCEQQAAVAQLVVMPYRRVSVLQECLGATVGSLAPKQNLPAEFLRRFQLTQSVKVLEQLPATFLCTLIWEQ